MIDFTAQWLLANLPKLRDLVHNDFRNGNVMVDHSGIVAVLDWEVAHIGDPMRDLAGCSPTLGVSVAPCPWVDSLRTSLQDMNPLQVKR